LIHGAVSPGFFDEAHHVLRIQAALGAPSVESFFGDFPSAQSFIES
jgi:hypothetical protein